MHVHVGVKVLIHHGHIVGNSPAEEHMRHQAICDLDNDSQLPANLNLQVNIIILFLHGLLFVTYTYMYKLCHATSDVTLLVTWALMSLFLFL